MPPHFSRFFTVRARRESTCLALTAAGSTYDGGALLLRAVDPACGTSRTSSGLLLRIPAIGRARAFRAVHHLAQLPVTAGRYAMRTSTITISCDEDSLLEALGAVHAYGRELTPWPLPRKNALELGTSRTAQSQDHRADWPTPSSSHLVAGPLHRKGSIVLAWMPADGRCKRRRTGDALLWTSHVVRLAGED